MVLECGKCDKLSTHVWGEPMGAIKSWDMLRSEIGAWPINKEARCNRTLSVSHSLLFLNPRVLWRNVDLKQKVLSLSCSCLLILVCFNPIPKWTSVFPWNCNVKIHAAIYLYIISYIHIYIYVYMYTDSRLDCSQSWCQTERGLLQSLSLSDCLQMTKLSSSRGCVQKVSTKAIAIQ